MVSMWQDYNRGDKGRLQQHTVQEHAQSLAMLTSLIARYAASWAGRRDLAV